MNSTLKPVLAGAGVPQAGGQASPAKGNVAGVNHAGHPQGAQNSLHHGTNNLVGQNLTHHAPPTPPVAAHAAPSLAPVSANMAQMAQNMSHHGNLSHMGQNSVTPSNVAVSPAKSTGAPLSLVQDKATASQPLALTRTPEKKEGESTVAQANGTMDSPKSASSAPVALKPQNPETNKEKQDIAKTSPSTPKPPEKSSAPSTPQKSEPSNAVGQADSPVQPKVATANEPPEKSPSKPTEPKPTPTADVAPTQTETKHAPESANNSQSTETVTPVAPQKSEGPVKEAKIEDKEKAEESVKEDPKPEKSVPEKVSIPDEKKPVEKESEPPKKEEKSEPITEEKKVPEPKTPVAKVVDVKPAVKSTMKLATVTPPVRKRRHTSPNKIAEGASSVKKVADADATPDTRSKRNRTQVQLYQSPTPEITMATKLSASAGRSTPVKPNDDKLIVFYKNEYLAVRNAEGGFYVCQTMQNVYRSTRKIKIRWLSQDKSDASGEIYKPDFYDVTDMECVLTTLSMSRAAGARGAGAGGAGGAELRAAEAARARSILQRALAAERAGAALAELDLTAEHPDGLDLSLYTDESQIEKKSRKRAASKSSPRGKQATNAAAPAPAARPARRAAPAARAAPPAPPAHATKTATVTDKSTPTKAKSAKKSPVKPSKPDTPAKTRGKPKRNSRESKASPIVPTPSTSTGKTTRTPRKPPSKK